MDSGAPAAALQFPVQVGGNRLQITAKGRRWIADITKDESVMYQEREFLKRIGKDVTEAFAMEMITIRQI
jgi:DNA-binding protein YbaB